MVKALDAALAQTGLSLWVVPQRASTSLSRLPDAKASRRTRRLADRRTAEHNGIV